jgi:hypothetical protein
MKKDVRPGADACGSEGVNTSGIAPADARPHSRWPAWKKVLAYALLAGLSFTAIWFVDVKVHRPAVMPRSQM